jgi:hypothetical protein
MKSQLRGIALILFGIQMQLSTLILNSILDFYIPWEIFGLLMGIGGLVLAFWKKRPDKTD